MSSPFFTAICFCRPAAGASRVGFSVSKRLGKAVIRNRIRRRLREAVRLELGWLPRQWDVVFRARQAAVDAPAGRLRQEVRRIFTRCKDS